MKAILVVDIDDSYIPIKNESITLERGIITYRDLNNNPYRIEITNFCLKPLPQKKSKKEIKQNGKYNAYLRGKEYGYNACLDEILGEQDNE